MQASYLSSPDCFKVQIPLIPGIGSSVFGKNPTPSCTMRKDPLLSAPEQHTMVCYTLVRWDVAKKWYPSLTLPCLSKSNKQKSTTGAKLKSSSNTVIGVLSSLISIESACAEPRNMRSLEKGTIAVARTAYSCWMMRSPCNSKVILISYHAKRLQCNAISCATGAEVDT